MNWTKIKYFKEFEFRCKCGCGYDFIDPFLVETLDELRSLYGRPIKVNSGCRCPKHNIDVGGASQSFHICIPRRGLAAQAADITPVGRVDRDTMWELQQACLQIIGVKYGLIRYTSFLHLDTRDKPYRGRR